MHLGAKKVSIEIVVFRIDSDKFQALLSAAAIVYRRKQGNVNQELLMDIVIAAEKMTIAKLLGDHIRCSISPDDIRLTENPDETGSFYIGFQLDHYVMSPNGEIEFDSLELVD